MLKNVKSGLKNLPQNCKLQLYYYFYSTQKLKDYLVVLLSDDRISFKKPFHSFHWTEIACSSAGGTTEGTWKLALNEYEWI